MKMIADVPILLRIEFGATKLKTNSFLKLKLGSVIELDKHAGDSLELKINGTPIALCEIVVQGDYYAARLIDIYDKKSKHKTWTNTSYPVTKPEIRLLFFKQNHPIQSPITGTPIANTLYVNYTKPTERKKNEKNFSFTYIHHATRL